MIYDQNSNICEVCKNNLVWWNIFRNLTISLHMMDTVIKHVITSILGMWDFSP